MAELLLVHGTDPARLLEHAADGFLERRPASAADPFPSPGYLLALRQGGIREDLIRLATERGIPGWFDPPLCVFQELPRRLGATTRTPCGDFEREVLLASVLRRAGGALFSRLRRPGEYVDIVLRHFGELVSEGVTPASYRAALSAEGDDFERRRNADLAGAYELYLVELERERRRDGRDGLADCARAVASDPEALAGRLGGRREVRLFGVADLKGGMRLLLEALVASPAIDRLVLYSAEPIALGEGLAPRMVALGADHPIGCRLFSGRERAEVGVDSVDAPDSEREVAAIAGRVRALADSGTPLSRIAVVARQARPYVDLMVEALDRVGVPAAARRRVAFVEIPVVRALLSLLAAAGDGWSRHGLTEVAEQPYFGNGLDPRLLSVLGYQQRLLGLAAWEAAFEELVRQTDPAGKEEREEEDRRRWTPSHPRAIRGRDGFLEFAGRAASLDAARPLAAWLEWLGGFLEEDPFEMRKRLYQLVPRSPADRDRLRVARLDLTGWRGLRATVGEWREAVTRWGGADEPLSAEQFHGRLAGMLDTDAILWTETPAGVQVLEGLAAAYRSFDHLFLVGLSSDHFPRRAPLSALFAEEERRRLVAAGLPLELRETWEARERALFRDLASAAAGRLTVSAPRMAGDLQEAIPSIFLEELSDVVQVKTEVIPTPAVILPGTPLALEAGAVAHAARVAAIERRRQTGALNPWNGLIEDPEQLAWLATVRGDDYTWSPTQLEAYAKCPWAYFSGRLLRLEEISDPDDDLAPTVRGTILHEALRRFFDQAVRRVGGPVLLRTPDLEWAEPMLVAALADAIAAGAETLHLGHPSLQATRRAELGRQLIRYLRLEVQLNEDMFSTGKKAAASMVRTGVIEHEVTFDQVRLERGGVVVKFRGRIDRIEAGIDERVSASHLIAAVDYKTSKFSTPGKGKSQAWDEGVVLQVPLYIHALTRLRPGKEPCRVEYRTVKKMERVHSLELVQVDRKRGRLEVDAKDQERLTAALDAVADHVKAIRRGEFPADPPESCGCPPWCHGLDICRVPGGPRLDP